MFTFYTESTFLACRRNINEKTRYTFEANEAMNIGFANGWLGDTDLFILQHVIMPKDSDLGVLRHGSMHVFSITSECRWTATFVFHGRFACTRACEREGHLGIQHRVCKCATGVNGETNIKDM